jgi:pyridoxine 5'-phosphate synthase PdxJ
MKNAPKRVTIYPSDIQRITGKGYRTSCRYLNEMKEDLGKDKKQFVTVSEFSDYSGIKKSEIEPHIK